MWGKPPDIHPWDYKYYVAHMTGDDITGSYNVSKALVDNFNTPGKGNLLIMEGLLANSTLHNRYLGLLKLLKEYPEVKVLDTQSDDAVLTKAYDITENWLTAFPDIDGIWLPGGLETETVIEVIKAKDPKLLGKIKLCAFDSNLGVLEGIRDGNIVATVSSNPPKHCAWGFDLAYAAYSGKIDPANEPKEHREFYTKSVLIDKNNVNSFLASANSPLRFDFEDTWSIFSSPIPIKD